MERVFEVEEALFMALVVEVVEDKLEEAGKNSPAPPL